MSLTPFDRNQLVLWNRYEFANYLYFHAHRIYYWLSDIAPIIVKYQLIQLGRDGIDNLPYLSWETKQEIKRWIADSHWEIQRQIDEWSMDLDRVKQETAQVLSELYGKTQQEIDSLLSDFNDAKQEIKKWLDDFFG
jgi:hypothetical protein